MQITVRPCYTVAIHKEGRMRRIIFSWFFVVWGLLYSGAVFAAEGCTINRVVGDVRILRGSETMAAKENDSLKKGDRLQTGDNCKADMSMNGLAGCRVLAGSRVEIASWKSEDMSLSVEKGNVILNLNRLPKESAFKLETPTAVATVRGTQFWGRVESKAQDNSVTTFAVKRGTIEIMDKLSNLNFKLEKGDALDLDGKAGHALLIRPALDEEMQAMDQADDIPVDTES